MYKLLIFNDDYGDEHNVPALCVMSNEEYQIWLKSPSGILNPKYEEEKVAFDAYEVARENFWQMLVDKGYTKSGYGNIGEIPKDDLETLQLVKEYYALKHPRYTRRVFSSIRAWLGNGGDCFGEGYEDYYLMEEFVEAGIVEVTDVSDEFAIVFQETGLAGVSLCNIFEIEIYEDKNLEEDEDE